MTSPALLVSPHADVFRYREADVVDVGGTYRADRPFPLTLSLADVF